MRRYRWHEVVIEKWNGRDSDGYIACVEIVIRDEDVDGVQEALWARRWGYDEAD